MCRCDGVSVERGNDKVAFRFSLNGRGGIIDRADGVGYLIASGNKGGSCAVGEYRSFVALCRCDGVSVERGNDEVAFRFSLNGRGGVVGRADGTDNGIKGDGAKFSSGVRRVKCSGSVAVQARMNPVPNSEFRENSGISFNRSSVAMRGDIKTFLDTV